MGLWSRGAWAGNGQVFEEIRGGKNREKSVEELDEIGKEASKM
jgi:hypothetical protein